MTFLHVIGSYACWSRQAGVEAPKIVISAGSPRTAERLLDQIKEEFTCPSRPPANQVFTIMGVSVEIRDR